LQGIKTLGSAVTDQWTKVNNLLRLIVPDVSALLRKVEDKMLGLRTATVSERQLP